MPYLPEILPCTKAAFLHRSDFNRSLTVYLEIFKRLVMKRFPLAARQGFRLLWAVFFLFCTLFTVAQSLNTLTPKEQSEGWKLLFDGTDLKGWHGYLSKPLSCWTARDGSIVLDQSLSKNWTDIVSDGEFSNFDLRLEWKIKPCGNSGIMFYVHEDPKYGNTFETGPEMQVVDRSCSADSKERLHRAGCLYDLIPVDTETVKEGGEWNRVEIKSDQGHLQLFLNGHKVIDTHLWDDHWRSLIAHSKFSSMPGFGTFKKGHISFQGTEPDSELWYRNIKIREW